MKAKKTAKTKKPAAARKGKLAKKGKAPKASKGRAVSQKTASSRRKIRKPKTDLPEILFEGDRPGSSPVGQAEKFALGVSVPRETLIEEGDLPESYGTQQVMVAPRDPHWLYVHWDLTRDQLRDYNRQSIHKHLVLRLSKPEQEKESAGEVHVHPESSHWFVHVAEAGVKYAVELGYYGKSKGWTSISTSTPALAPPDVVSSETDVRFATIPSEVALSKLVDIVKTEVGNNLSLAHAIEEIRLAGHPALPPVSAGESPKPWTPTQERALAEVINMRQIGHVSVGSMDITELVRRELQHNFSSVMAALGGSSSMSSPSSPQGGAPTGPGGFWFNVNAELIVYGASEPGANVTIGGQPITLRPDGSFSFRFALPDGQYELPVTAVSADGAEARHAALQFSRATKVIGDVGQHPQDPALKTPTPENIS